MNWISADEQLPDLEPIEGTESATSRPVLVWAIMKSTNEPGFAEVARLSRGRWNGWLWSGDGAMEEDGFTVTHWAEIEPPQNGGSDSTG